METLAIKSIPDTERKTISISSKRQITIPQKFFSILGFTSKAECVVHGNELVIRPVKEQESDDFSEMILSELIDQGLSGKELLTAFKIKKAEIHHAVDAMRNDAKKIASGAVEYSTYDDIFNTEE